MVRHRTADLARIRQVLGTPAADFGVMVCPGQNGENGPISSKTDKNGLGRIILCCAALAKKNRPRCISPRLWVTRCRSWICARNAPKPRASVIRPPSTWRMPMFCSASARRRKSNSPPARKQNVRAAASPRRISKSRAGSGCPECYKTFAEGLEGLLKTMHKGTRHAGKVPAALRESREQSDRLKLLQKKLAKAIDEENFEQAASLRDEIKQIIPARTGPECDVSHGHP